MNNTPKGKFKKGQSGNPAGRPKDPPGWDSVRDIVKDAIVRFMAMSASEVRQYMKGNPTTAEKVCFDFLTTNPGAVVERFLGKLAQPIAGELDLGIKRIEAEHAKAIAAEIEKASRLHEPK